MQPPVLALPEKGKNTILVGLKVLDLSRGNKKKHALKVATAGFDLGFAATFHKIQGKTVSKIILCQYEVPRNLGLTSQAL